MDTVTRDDPDAFGGAEVGEPPTGEHWLDGNHEILPVRGESSEERIRPRSEVAVQHDFARVV
jgi:hypothetical protein